MNLDREEVEQLIKEAQKMSMDFIRIISTKTKRGEDYQQELKWLICINNASEFYFRLLPNEDIKE